MNLSAMQPALRRTALLALLLAVGVGGQSTIGPSWSWNPERITQAVINFADPPGVTPPPVPPIIWTTATAGLNNRDYRIRPPVAKKKSGTGTASAPEEAQKQQEKQQQQEQQDPDGPDNVEDVEEVEEDSSTNDGGVQTATVNMKAAAQAAAEAAAEAEAAGQDADTAVRRRLRSIFGTPLRGGSRGGGGNGTAGGEESGRSTSGRTKSSFFGPPNFGGPGLFRRIRGPNVGFDGIGVPETRLVPEDLSLAVGNTGAIHTANSLIRFYKVDVAGKAIKGHIEKARDAGTFLKQVWTADFFYAVTRRTDGSNGCDYGVFSAAVAYDKWVGRYLISAICDDTLFPKVLLAVSAVDSVTDYWNLYAVPAENSFGNRTTSWTCPTGSRALPDYSQVGYNRDGVYVTWVAICEETLIPRPDTQSSAMLYAFPKWAVYGGNNPNLPLKRFWVPVFTGVDLCEAVRNQQPIRLPPGSECGIAFRQMQPVMPQTAVDVRAGETFFVVDYSQDLLSRRSFVLVALVATGTLWDHDGLGSPTPYIVGRFVDRGQDAYINDDVFLLQDQGTFANAPNLDAGAVNPRGYWNGGAAYANGRVYIADRVDVVDPPTPPTVKTAQTAPLIYNPRPAIYWAWVQPTFTAYGPCACYWNFNWGYGFGWIWDRACYNPITGVTTAGRGGFYTTPPGGRRKLLGEQVVEAMAASGAMGAMSAEDYEEGRLPHGWSTTPLERDRSRIVPLPNVTMGRGEQRAASVSGGSWGQDSPRPVRREPNVVYSAAAGAVAYTIRTQAPPGSRIIYPPKTEVAAAMLKPEDMSDDEITAASEAVGKLDGSWRIEAANTGVKASGLEHGAWRDVYMSAAYYDPAGNWNIEFGCRFRANWNIRNTVTLLATVIKSGVVTYGSAAGQGANPLGLAYPQVAVRGGTMLITFTYASWATMPALVGATTTGVPAHAGVGFTLIDPLTRVTPVYVAFQQDPSYGPILQENGRFGDYAGIDIHPLSGRIWSANLCVWSPAWTVDGRTVISNAGARITIFS